MSLIRCAVILYPLALRIIQNGMTALMYAASAGHRECIEALVHYGANVDIQATVRLLLNYLNFGAIFEPFFDK